MVVRLFSFTEKKYIDLMVNCRTRQFI